MSGTLNVCWRLPRGCCGYCRCFKGAGTGLDPISPRGWKSPAGRCAAMWTNSGRWAIPSIRHPARKAGISSARVQACLLCCWMTRRQLRSRWDCAWPRPDPLMVSKEASVRALSKIEQILPPRLGRRVAALQAVIVMPARAEATVPAGTLSTIAAACRDCEALKFRYRDHRAGTASARFVEPHRLVSTGRRWYLVAWDSDRKAWRTFRVDRMQPRLTTGPRFAPREPPARDLAAYVARRRLVRSAVSRSRQTPGRRRNSGRALAALHRIDRTH